MVRKLSEHLLKALEQKLVPQQFKRALRRFTRIALAFTLVPAAAAVAGLAVRSRRNL